MKLALPAITAASALTFASAAGAQVSIDNDLATTDLGYWQVDVLPGGEARDALVTARGTPSGTLFEAAEVVFDYFSYVDVGLLGDAFRLSEAAISGPRLLNAGAGPDEVTSSGSFPGEAGNTIIWSVSSTIPDGTSVMTNTFRLTAASGTLGDIRLFQYLDEDVFGVGDDIFFTRGTASGLNLELFTVDGDEAIGVSHSGGLAPVQRLVAADFIGWAVCEFDTMRPRIEAGEQDVSRPGTVCPQLAGAAIMHPVVGAALGPADVVSVLAWDVDPDATTAVIVTTLGGVPEAPTAAGLAKELTSGPDSDEDEAIDLAVEVGQATATTYDFTIAYGPDVETPFAIILDTVPAEWQVTEVNGLIPDDGCIAGDDGNGGAGTVEVEPVDGDCDEEGEPTRITWLPDPGVGTSTLNVVLETRGGFGGPFLPAACGPLRLNEGASAFEVNEFNEVVVDAGGEPVVVFGPTSPLTLVAVEDLDGGGIVPDGSGDEDGDGRTDADEALNAGTDPCDAGPSFEMCWSRPCPPRP